MERRTRYKREGTFNETKDSTMERIDVEEMVVPSFNETATKVFNSAKTCVLNAFWIVFDACGIYLMWVTLHYAASHLYVYFCAPSTLVGFLYSPFIISAPHCRALRWVIFNGAVSVDNMWLVFGTWLCSKLIIPRQMQNT